VKLVVKSLDDDLVLAGEMLTKISSQTPLKEDLTPEKVAHKYLTKTYAELFYYINVKKGISFITDSGCFVDTNGRTMTEETFKRSLPHKTYREFNSQLKTPIRQFDFFTEYLKDNNRSRFSSVAFMIEDELMDIEEDSRGMDGENSDMMIATSLKISTDIHQK
jgi:hypothetical protein